MKWKCPKCGSKPEKCGKGKCKEKGAGYSDCRGFLCECEDLEAKHSRSSPCSNAVCYHCGWYGKFPKPLFNPKKLTGWAKRAYAEGWIPPDDWKPKEK